MKNYPNQASTFARIRDTLEVVRDLKDAGQDAKSDDVLGYAYAKVWPVVGDDRDRRRDGAQRYAGGLVDQVELAAIGAQIVELQQPLSVLDS